MTRARPVARRAYRVSRSASSPRSEGLAVSASARSAAGGLRVDQVPEQLGPGGEVEVVPLQRGAQARQVGLGRRRAGGWVWRPVVARLRAAGHEAWAPTLTGMGERVHLHLASPEVGLDTHVLDVANVLGYEDLQDAVLVGHSYGGMVITGAAERAPGRLAHLVYLDALVPADGQAMVDFYPPAVRAALDAAARAHGHGWRVPVGPEFGPRATPHLLKPLTQSLAVRDPAARRCPARTSPAPPPAPTRCTSPSRRRRRACGGLPGGGTANWRRDTPR